MNSVQDIAVHGESGRMGQWVRKLVETEYHGKLNRLPVPSRRGPSTNFPLDFLESTRSKKNTVTIIDFSSPSASVELAKEMLNPTYENPPFLVIGTTGFTQDQLEVLHELSEITRVLMSSNFSLGIQAVLTLLKTGSPLFQALDFTPVLIERHHRHKKDLPSGTALALQTRLRLNNHDQVSQKVHPAFQNVQSHSVRAGEVIGEHELTFYGPAEEVKISHSAQDRSIFARGAIEAALWLSSTALNRPSSSMYSFENFFESKYLPQPKEES